MTETKDQDEGGNENEDEKREKLRTRTRMTGAFYGNLSLTLGWMLEIRTKVYPCYIEKSLLAEKERATVDIPSSEVRGSFLSLTPGATLKATPFPSTPNSLGVMS